MKVSDIRYVARTAMGKPLFIVVNQKAMNSSGVVKNTYSLTDDLLMASKTLNKISVNTMIDDYLAATRSTKTFETVPICATFEIVEVEDDG